MIDRIKDRIKLFFGIKPSKCPYCGGELIEKGFELNNRRIECRKCKRVLIEGLNF